MILSPKENKFDKKRGIKTRNMANKKSIKERIYNFFKWLKKECKDWKTLVVLMCVIVVVYAPVWIGGLMYAIFGLEWCGVMASLMAAFWLGPLTPFFPLCIAITLSIKKIMQVKKKGKNKKNKKQQRKVLSGSVK